LLTKDKITALDIGFYLKATGTSIVDETALKKPDYIKEPGDWLNILQLSS